MKINLEMCSNQPMLFIIIRILNTTDNKKLKNNKEIFISYFKENNINGCKFNQMGSKEFSEQIKNFGGNNTKLNGHMKKKRNK